MSPLVAVAVLGAGLGFQAGALTAVAVVWITARHRGWGRYGRQP